MLKHRGFPSRLPSSDFQFTIRRANKAGPTSLILRERYADRRPADRRADEGFLRAIWQHFGREPFERGNLDAGRLSWFLGREIRAVDPEFDPCSYSTVLCLDASRALAAFPQIFVDESF